MEEKEVLDFEKICRLCLLEKGSLLRIFAKKKRNNTTPLPIRIMTCTSLEVSCILLEASTGWLHQSISDKRGLNTVQKGDSSAAMRSLPQRRFLFLHPNRLPLYTLDGGNVIAAEFSSHFEVVINRILLL